MAHKLCVLVIHGMGTQGPDFADEMIEEINEAIADQGQNPGDIHWARIFWADILSAKEAGLWRRLSRDNDLDYVRLRKFILNALGDAAAYQRVNQQNSIYDQIHDKVRDVVSAARAEIEKDVPVVLLAHSLGAYIMSNYIWDRQNVNGTDSNGSSPFEEMKTLCAIFTFGCNIPLFSLAYDPILSISFPPSIGDIAQYFRDGASPTDIQAVTKWDNYFDSDDVLGYPLKPLSAS